MLAFEDEISAALKAAIAIPGWGDVLLKAMPSGFSEDISEAYRLGTAHPEPKRWFRALEEVGPPKNVRVVILGQDPYHGHGQADGLAFSVPMGHPLPPSLRNIFKEISASCGGVPPGSGDLVSWASQGVLLLNDVLSVAHGTPRSHRSLGWQSVTSSILTACAERPAAFLLWGTMKNLRPNTLCSRMQTWRKTMALMWTRLQPKLRIRILCIMPFWGMI